MSSNIENINYNDFKNICRVCMFDCGIKFCLDHVVSNIYRKLTDLQFETNDDLPKQICGKCYDKMSEIHEFTFQCVRTHAALMECLKQKQLNELDESIIPKASEIKVEPIENIDLPKTSYHIEGEITIEEHKIELVKDEHVFDDEQNIESDDDLFASNASNINSESDEYSDYNNTSSEGKYNIQYTGEHSYKCDQCSKSFRRKDQMKIHVRTHTGERPYKCAQCSKLFNRLDHMKAHVRTHTGERPFKCDQCSKSYIHSSDLKTHMCTHTGERPYKCAQCSKTFIQSSCLNMHMRTHTGERPYKCTQCTKSFAYSTVLKRHMRTHTGERPHICKHCSKSFAQSHVLRDHMRTHTGERPYKCDKCSKSFSQSSNLNTHMRTHHSSDV